ncbi:hypothetical protein K3495_g8662 [Podosphaera aphanis]|nr:hypothetical protein K3495_g8662 [Podosphaera aphanis]
MNYDEDFPALQSETRPIASPQTTPPAPPAPPPTPPSTAPPITVNETPSTSNAARTILNPVPPSKRAAQMPTELSKQSSEDDSQNLHAYLPQELCEIIEQRQRRERAWHVRLAICASLVCNLESTLSNYKDDLEKEEADIIRGYLQQAIARLAASESVPSPPKVPIHTKPVKSKNSNTAKENNGKKVLVATPALSTLTGGKQQNNALLETIKKGNNQEQQHNWVTIARNGHKKRCSSAPSQAPLSSNLQEQQVYLPTRPHTRTADLGKKKKNNENDNRLFLRLPSEHEWRKLSPAGIREVVVKRLSISPSLIGKIKSVRSGFALSPSNSEGRETMLKAATGLFLSDAKLEPATNWTPLLVPTVPRFIMKTDGRIEVTKNMLAEEIERVTTVRPSALKPFGQNNPNAPHKTWMAYFSKAPRPGFRVFDQSGIVSKFKQQRPIDFCNRCNGYHPSRFCSRAPSCGNCGSKMHEEDACKSLTKCKNCGGPHRSDSKKCLARPNRLGAPTKEQMKIYRQAGDREYHATAKAKAAEERALRAEARALSVEFNNDSGAAPEVAIEVSEENITTQIPTELTEDECDKVQISAAVETPAADSMEL